MKCQEFEQTWIDLLDTETLGRIAGDTSTALTDPDLARREHEAREHARRCARCGPAHARNETLRQALRAWTTRNERAPGPSPDLLTRVLAESALAARLRTRRRRLVWSIGAGLAAALLAFLFLPGPWRLDRGGGHGRVRAAGARGTTDADVLREALADATDATWDLARTTSEPAARLGREVIEAATQAREQDGAESSGGDSTAFRLASLSSVLRGGATSSTGAALLQDLGDGLAASVRPLSSSARQAFGFLRTPNVEKREHAGTPPASKGA
jgi:hypothetical protein